MTKLFQGVGAFYELRGDELYMFTTSTGHATAHRNFENQIDLKRFFELADWVKAETAPVEVVPVATPIETPKKPTATRGRPKKFATALGKLKPKGKA